MNPATYFAETRPQFLVLSLVLGFLGAAIASWSGGFGWGITLLATAGLVALHIAVNVFNDYFDFRSGIDLAAPRTPFSGGSGILPSGAMPARGALVLASIALVAGVTAGLLLWRLTGPPVLWLGLFGVAAVIGYNTVFSRILLGEIVTGLALGALPVLGLVYVNTLRFPAEAIFASVPSAFLVLNLLLLNEFPDAEADRLGGRRHIVIVFGSRAAAWIYVALGLGAHMWVLAGIMGAILPVWTALALLSLPATAIACRDVLRYHSEPPKLLSAQAANVLVTLAFQFLLGVGFLLA